MLTDKDTLNRLIPALSNIELTSIGSQLEVVGAYIPKTEGEKIVGTLALALIGISATLVGMLNEVVIMGNLPALRLFDKSLSELLKIHAKYEQLFYDLENNEALRKTPIPEADQKTLVVLNHETFAPLRGILTPKADPTSDPRTLSFYANAMKAAEESNGTLSPLTSFDPKTGKAAVIISTSKKQEIS